MWMCDRMLVAVDVVWKVACKELAVVCVGRIV